MRSPSISSATDCPRCGHATATMFLGGASAVSVTYRCLDCSHAYEVPAGDLPEIIRAVVLRLSQVRGRGGDAGMTLILH
jgi:DNA-directed RNA polymerase subunit RPC12/RpoP